eukprot:7788287-Pyramimonas_sp.AAC.1
MPSAVRGVRAAAADVGASAGQLQHAVSRYPQHGAGREEHGACGWYAVPTSGSAGILHCRPA